MVSKQKKWFKSAFSEDKPIQNESPNRSAGKRDVFQTLGDDSIDFTDLDLSNLEKSNANTTINRSLNTTKTVQPNVSIIHHDFKSSNWIENFAPRTKNELAIHPKKVVEIEEWFTAVKTNKIGSRAPILLITGPSGSGKTTTIKVIAQEFGFTISEWITPVDIEYVRHDRADMENVTFSENQNDKFSQFLFQSSRYRSVFDTSSKRVVLVEDFPNIFIKDPSSFEGVLERYTVYGRSPLIFIVTDTKSKSLNISFNLFTDENRARFNIASIAFNAVADTMLKKGLKRITDIMEQPGFKKYYTNPNKDIIDSIVLSSQGDIRSAVINLHFASQKNSTKLATEDQGGAKKTPATKKTRAKKSTKLKSLGTDQSVSMLHSIGRIFNPKYQDVPDENGNKQLLHSPDEIASLLCSQPSSSVNLIHNNYIGHFQQFEDIVEAIDYLSSSDIIMNEWRSDQSHEIGLNVAVRGMMVSNQKPVTGRWMPIRSTKNDNNKKTFRSADYGKELEKLGIPMLITPNTLASDYKSYVKVISPAPVTDNSNNSLVE